MALVDDIVKLMRQNPKGIRFNDLCKVCEKNFGKPRERLHNPRRSEI